MAEPTEPSNEFFTHNFKGEKMDEVSQDKQMEVTLKGEHLSVVSQDLATIPKWIAEKYGKSVKQLDLSFNQITYGFNKAHVSQQFRKFRIF